LNEKLAAEGSITFDKGSTARANDEAGGRGMD